MVSVKTFVDTQSYVAKAQMKNLPATQTNTNLSRWELMRTFSQTYVELMSPFPLN